jgi:hypothetical protein
MAHDLIIISLSFRNDEFSLTPKHLKTLIKQNIEPCSICRKVDKDYMSKGLK